MYKNCPLPSGGAPLGLVSVCCTGGHRGKQQVWTVRCRNPGSLHQEKSLSFWSAFLNVPPLTLSLLRSESPQVVPVHKERSTHMHRPEELAPLLLQEETGEKQRFLEDETTSHRGQM